MTKEERLNRIEQELRLRNDIGGTDKDWMLKIIREQDAALAEAREVLEFYGNRQLYDAADSQISGCPIENDEGTQARTWLAAHPAKVRDADTRSARRTGSLYRADL